MKAEEVETFTLSITEKHGRDDRICGGVWLEYRDDGSGDVVLSSEFAQFARAQELALRESEADCESREMTTIDQAIRITALEKELDAFSKLVVAAHTAITGIAHSQNAHVTYMEHVMGTVQKAQDELDELRRNQ